MNPLQHQLEVLEILKNKSKGKVILPTGTGKTIIQALDLVNTIHQNPGFGVHAVLAPRIMLAFQLLVEVQKVLYGKVIDVKYMSVHSGGSLEETNDMALLRLQSSIPYSNIISSTSPSEIKKEIGKAKKENKPLVIFSTYNSSERILEGLGRLNIVTTYCDEAHYLVRESFHPFLKKVRTDRLYFFTATEKHSDSDEGLGMNNQSVYGETLYFMSPREAIDKGLILRPRMHFVMTETKDYKFREDLDNSFSNIVSQSYREHEYSIGGQNGKLLVVVRGSKDMERFIVSKDCKNLIRSGVHVFAVSSREEIGNWYNNSRISRHEFLEKLKQIGADPSQRMIVLHYDILTEGIDTIFTGVLPFKGMGKLKFIQTYGRVARLDPEDRKKIISNEMSPDDLENMYKPYGMIIIPVILFEDIDDNERLQNLVHELRDYGFSPVDDVIISNAFGGGIAVVQGIQALNELKKKEPRVGNFIETIQSSIEDERVASLSDEEFVVEFF